MWSRAARRHTLVGLQICDDSEDQITRDMIDDKVTEWKEAGTQIEVMRRGQRVGCGRLFL